MRVYYFRDVVFLAIDLEPNTGTTFTIVWTKTRTQIALGKGTYIITLTYRVIPSYQKSVGSLSRTVYLTRISYTMCFTFKFGLSKQINCFQKYKPIFHIRF